MPEHGQIIIGRRPGQELVILAGGVEVARVRVTGGQTRLAVSGPGQVEVVRGEALEHWQPRGPEGRWDLLGAEAAAELAGETVAGFLAAVDRGELPAPAKQWRKDGRGGWAGDSRWRRGTLLAAVASRDTQRRQRIQEMTTDSKKTPADQLTLAGGQFDGKHDGILPKIGAVPQRASS